MDRSIRWRGHLWMKMRRDIRYSVMNEHHDERRYIVLRTDRSVCLSPSFILIESGATSLDPMVSTFQNDAVIELAAHCEVHPSLGCTLPSSLHICPQKIGGT